MTQMQPAAPMQPAPAPAPSNGLALAGMILGIISAALCWMWCAPYIPIIVGIVGLILSIVGMSKAKTMNGEGKGKAKVGLILSIVGIVVPLILLMLVVMVFAGAANQIQKSIEMYNNMR